MTALAAPHEDLVPVEAPLTESLLEQLDTRAVEMLLLHRSVCSSVAATRLRKRCCSRSAIHKPTHTWPLRRPENRRSCTRGTPATAVTGRLQPTCSPWRRLGRSNASRGDELRSAGPGMWLRGRTRMPGLEYCADAFALRRRFCRRQEAERLLVSALSPPLRLAAAAAAGVGCRFRLACLAREGAPASVSSRRP